jgi:hypothetical protein
MPAFTGARRGLRCVLFCSKPATGAGSLNEELVMIAMKKTTSVWICGAMLAAVSTLAVAERANAATTTRQQRMDEALADYRSGQPPASAKGSADCAQMSDGGTFARAEASLKRGACKTGHAIERGVNKTGHAIGNAGRKTGDALRRTGEKMGGSSDKAKSDETPR